jgi:alpha-L-fucosidase
VVRYGATILTAPLVATDGEKDLREVDLGSLPLVQGDPADLSLAIEGAAQPVRVFDLRLTP